MGNKEISDLTGLPRPTVSRLTSALTQLGYMEHDPRIRKYRLTPLLFAIGSRFLQTADILSISRPILHELARKTSAFVALGICCEDDIVFIETFNCADRPASYFVGSHVALHKSASGMAYLHLAPKQETETLLSLLKRNRPGDLTEFKALHKRTQAELNRQQFCVVSGQVSQGIITAAGSIRSPNGSRIVCCSISGSRLIFSENVFYEELGPHLVMCLQEITKGWERGKSV